VVEHKLTWISFYFLFLNVLVGIHNYIWPNKNDTMLDFKLSIFEIWNKIVRSDLKNKFVHLCLASLSNGSQIELSFLPRMMRLAKLSIASNLWTFCLWHKQQPNSLHKIQTWLYTGCIPIILHCSETMQVYHRHESRVKQRIPLPMFAFDQQRLVERWIPNHQCTCDRLFQLHHCSR